MRVVSLVLFSLSAGLLNERAQQNPVARVVELIRGLKGKIEADGKAEQKVYDKFACWCEDTTARKAAAIEKAKLSIEELSKSIAELNGKLGSSSAEIAQLKKDIASTKESILKAEEMRHNEKAEYLKTKAALEQAIGNLEKAIEVLGKLPQKSRKGFINAKDGMNSGTEAGLVETAGVVETDVMTIAAGVRSAMHLYAKTNDVQANDFATVKNFLTNPASLMATSVAPHKGTYNTQSTAIQGILAEMHETMERDLVDATSEENERQNAFDELHATKTKDLKLLEATLVKKNAENGNDTKDLADNSQEREETQAQLKTDEAFFETTKDSCKAKADMWSERSRLRTEELAGIGQAIDILTADDAKAIFNSADTTFVQVSVKTQGDARTRAYNILKQVATKADSLSLAMIASKVFTTGHFDAVLGDIDKMIQALRDEERADVKHRDWCQTEETNSASKRETLEYDMKELKAKVGRLEAKKGELETAITETETEMSDLETAMGTALDNRKSENSAFKQALKDDTDAVALIGKAIGALSKFYTNNGLALVEKKHHHKKAEPEYTADPDVAPETFGGEGEGGGYGGRSSENTGIVAILGLIKEDLEKEMTKSKSDEAASLAAYQTLYDESAANMQALEDKKTSLESEVAQVQKDTTDTNAVHFDTNAADTATSDYVDGLKANCDWVKRTFDTRRGQRQAEISGLQNAKSVLSGATQAEASQSGFLARSSVAGKQQPSVQDELRELDSAESSFEHSFLQR